MSRPRARVRPAARGAGPGGTTRPARRPPRLAVAALLAGLVALTVLGTAPPLAAAAPALPSAPEDDPLVLRVDALNPRVVTADGPGELLVTGSVTNRGATSIGDLGLRVQRGVALRGDRDARTALAGDETDEQVRPEFTAVARVLDPGDEVPFTLRVPLRGPAASTLGLGDPGVYPLIVNANGQQGTASSTRLGAVRLLLPVLDLPGARPTAARDDRPADVGVLYPIADRPRRLPVLPGQAPLLSDDDLAASMAPGGRLAGLVDALGRSAPLGSPAAVSVCLAVDADLLDTARAMAGGYQVRTPGGVVAGRGAEAAGQWLGAVRAQATGRCVVALPYADTDVVATSRGNLTDLTTAARVTGQRRVAELLGRAPLDATTAPADGVVDERTVADLVTGGARTLFVGADVLSDDPPPGGVARLAGPAGTSAAVVARVPLARAAGGARTLFVGADVLSDDPPPGGVARLAGPAGTSAAVLALDPLARAAFGARPETADGITSPAGTAAPLAAQDALGMLVLRARQAATGARDALPVVLAAPPPAWAASSQEAGAYLDTVGDLARRGLVRPIDVGRLAVAGSSGAPLPAAALADPEATVGLGEDVVARARVVRDRQRDLFAASRRDRIGAPSPSDLLDPLTEGVLRGLSASRRGDPAAQDAAMREVEGQMTTVSSMVRVVQPSGPYSLGSNDAPLLLTVENRLPVAVNVQVVLDPTPGLRTQPQPVVTVPADGSRQLSVGIEIARSGQFAVDAHAETPGGEPLGPTARLLLRSTAYGTITVWLTASAGVVLVILASIRITRRVLAARRARRSRRNRRRAGDRRGPTPPDRPGTPGGPTEPPTRELQTR